MHRYVTDFILDIVQNSFEADSNNVELVLREDDRYLDMTVRDDGKGMSHQMLEKVLDPYQTDGIKHIKRKVGLGLPFLVQATKSAGGSFDIQSEVSKGTVVKCRFDLCNIDTPPMGDIPSTLLALVSHPAAKGVEIERSLSTSKGSDSYHLSREKLLEVLGSFTTVATLNLLMEYLQSQEEALDRFKVDHIPVL